MITISLCMIVKNEENILKRCLDSIYDIVDEIIIVDTGSVDKTKEVCRDYTNNIYDFKWIDDFSKARNFSFDKATKDYILWLDADEYLDEKNRKKFINLKENLNKSISVISTETHMCIDENNNPKIVARRNRIIKRSEDFKWVGYVHEYISIEGINESTVYDSDICIIHDKVKNIDDRNLKIYEKNLKDGKILSNRDLYYYGRELYCNLKYEKSIEILKEFIKVSEFKEETIDALCKIGECYIKQKEYKLARIYLYKAFEEDIPRADIMYNIAYSFEEEEKYLQAISWYKIILNTNISCDTNQCINMSYLRFKPHLNLCCCYYELKDLPRAYYHHQKCMELNPNDECVKCNEKYFNSIIKER
ncbi:glycosyltransferase [Romboutsia sp. 1001713B170131_170501_G6]|uniref:glycosyltransferase n=1 Tax=Romboutsia sp. 1001713B170131_170501_G6 TaxID=2787108 RepID=UPI0018A92E07|nr:glycosyltransferase [Romboutsia sp. 1001713B170131_170501_G6]